MNLLGLQPKYSLLLWHADLIMDLEMLIASVTHLTGDMGDYLLMFDSSWNSSITMHEKLIWRQLFKTLPNIQPLLPQIPIFLQLMQLTEYLQKRKGIENTEAIRTLMPGRCSHLEVTTSSHWPASHLDLLSNKHTVLDNFRAYKEIF